MRVDCSRTWKIHPEEPQIKTNSHNLRRASAVSGTSSSVSWTTHSGLRDASGNTQQNTCIQVPPSASAILWLPTHTTPSIAINLWWFFLLGNFFLERLSFSHWFYFILFFAILLCVAPQRHFSYIRYRVLWHIKGSIIWIRISFCEEQLALSATWRLIDLKLWIEVPKTHQPAFKVFQCFCLFSPPQINIFTEYIHRLSDVHRIHSQIPADSQIVGGP